MRIAIYARVSSAEQAAGTSIESQIAECRAWAGRNGATVAAEYTDAGESARTANRPAFLRMIAAAKSGAFEAVIVHKLDRFARDSHDFCVTRAVLAGHGVQIVSVTEPSADDPAGRFLQTILSAVAQLDNEVRAERSRSGMAARAMAGYWCHKAPLGFRLRRTPDGAILDPHPDEAPAVADLFGGLASGRIAPELAPQALTAGLGGRRFQTHHVRLIVTQRAYCGQIQGRLTDGRIIQARWQGLVDTGTWERANAAFASVGRPQVRGDAAEWPLRRWTVCADCGRPLTGSTTRTKYGAWSYYHCPKGHVRIRRDVAHERMAELLNTLAARGRKTIAVLRALTRVALVEERARSRTEADRHRRTVSGLQAQQDRLLEALVTGTIDRDTYRAKADELAARKADAWRQAAAADGSEMDTDAALDLCAEFFDRIGSLWLTAAPEQQHLLMRAMIGQPMVVSRDQRVTTNLDSSVFSILDGLSGASARMAPPAGDSYNGYIAQILTLLAPVRVLMRGGVECLETA